MLTGAARATALVAERLQELGVGGVQVAHQVDDGVGLGRALVVRVEERAACARPTSADIDAMPGVSISVATRRLGVGQSTSSWSTSLGAGAAQVDAPARRRGGRPAAARARPSRGNIVIRGCARRRGTR